MSRLALPAALAGALFLTGIAHGEKAAQPATAATASAIPYTAAQATRGKLQFIQHCARCHGGNLDGTTEIPPLRARFIRHWSGGTMDEVVGYISRAMPIDKPGSLDPDANAAIMAYLLQANGFPAGSSDLPSDPVALRRIPLMQLSAAGH